jgi:hypothetical protein
MNRKIIILSALSLALAAGIVFIPTQRKTVEKPKVEIGANGPIRGKSGPLAEFLKSESLPGFIKNDWQRFQSALSWAEIEAGKAGFELDRNPKAWKRANPEITALPKEISVVFANPSVIWGREPKSNKWGAVIVLSDKTKHRFVLANITDALGLPKLEISNVSADASECLGFGPWHDVPVPPLAESWKAWESEPITFLRWLGPGQAGLLELQLNPKVGIAKEATNLEGDTNYGDFPFLISRDLVATAEVVGIFPRPKHPTAKDVWFKSQGQLFLTSEEQWNEWSKSIKSEKPKE